MQTLLLEAQEKGEAAAAEAAALKDALQESEKRKVEVEVNIKAKQSIRTKQ